MDEHYWLRSTNTNTPRASLVIGGVAKGCTNKSDMHSTSIYFNDSLSVEQVGQVLY